MFLVYEIHIFSQFMQNSIVDQHEMGNLKVLKYIIELSDQICCLIYFIGSNKLYYISPITSNRCLMGH